MWAGGSISWPPSSQSSSSSSLPNTSNLANLLRLGQQVIERRSIDKVEYKKGMVFIHQKREIRDPDDRVGVREVRTHVFRPPSSSTSLSKPSSSTTSPNPSPTTQSTSDLTPDISFTYLPTSPLLFRYSALTFNAHKIHYDHPHSTRSAEQGGEGQEGLLVHGPLTATLLIELAAREGWVRDFRYRAVSPMVVDQEVRLVGSWRSEAEGAGPDKGTRVLEMMAVQATKVCMKATAYIEV